MNEQIFALIKGGIVRNLIVADQAFVDSIAADYDAVIDCTNEPNACMGGAYQDGAFVPVGDAP
jgi:hypothetical protein